MLNLFSRHRWLYPFLSLGIALGVIVSSPIGSSALDVTDLIRGGIQVIQGIQLSSLSDDQEVELGGQINQQLTSSKIQVVRNSALNEYVNSIGQRLIPYSDRPNLRYRFQVVDDPKINAFATMGGYVYIHTGVIAAADNEAQLASVIGHEMGHIVGRHAMKQMKSVAIQQGLLAGAGLDQSTAVNLGVKLALTLPKGRKAEYEADQLGLKMISRAGYAQSEMPAFMAKLMRSGTPPTILSSHPAAADRVERLKRLISQNPTSGEDGLDNAAYRSRLQGLRS